MLVMKFSKNNPAKTWGHESKNLFDFQHTMLRAAMHVIFLGNKNLVFVKKNNKRLKRIKATVFVTRERETITITELFFMMMDV